MCNGTPFTVEKISPRAGIELGPLDQTGLIYVLDLGYVLFCMACVAIGKKEVLLAFCLFIVNICFKPIFFVPDHYI